jgi:hypothetical protein
MSCYGLFVGSLSALRNRGSLSSIHLSPSRLGAAMVTSESKAECAAEATGCGSSPAAR